MRNKVRLFGKFEKVTKRDDGSLDVEGIASSETKDSDGEIIKASAIRGAIPAYMEWANVREMHQPIAAGHAVSLAVDEGGVTRISAHIDDKGSVAKVESGTLKGFSVAGTVPVGGRNKDDAKIIEAIELTEISLVDRPANPDARITLVKREKNAAVDKVAKGLWTVGSFASCVQDLQYLQESTAWEAEYEGDDSQIPARIKAAVKELCGILCDIVEEETAELVGESAEAEAVAMAAKPGALAKSEKFAGIIKAFTAAAKGEVVEKKGAKFSAATKKSLADIHSKIDDCHKAIGECSKAMHATGYADADSPEANDDKSKAFGIEVQKLSAQLGEVEKRAKDAEARAESAETIAIEADEAIKGLLAERTAVTAELDAAKLALSQKGSLRVVATSKEQDGKAPVASKAAGAASDDEKSGVKAPSTLDAIKSARKTTTFQPNVGVPSER